jgi:hypothetical protein
VVDENSSGYGVVNRITISIIRLTNIYFNANVRASLMNLLRLTKLPNGHFGAEYVACFKIVPFSNTSPV